MTERIVRDVDIVAGKLQKGGAGTGTTEAALNEYNGVQVTTVQQVDSSVGQAGLNTAIGLAGIGSVVIANGAFTGTTPIVLDSDRTLIGGGAVLPLRGATSGVQVNFTAPGAAGSISANLSGSAVVNLGNNSVLGGLTITNTNTDTFSRGILANGSPGVTVFGSTINTNSDLGPGMHFTNASDGRILNSVINSLGSDGRAIMIQNSARITADGNTMTARYIGIEVTSSSDIVLTGNSIQSQFGSGIYSQSSTNVTIGGNSFGPLIANTQIVLFGTSINSAASTGNVDNTSPAAARCFDLFGSTGTIGFTTGANCTFP